MPRQIKKRSKTIESCKNNALTDIPPPKITLPWPPVVSKDDFIRNRPLSKVDIKSPNSFFVYRAAYVKQLLIEQHKFKMTQVSKWASLAWKEESKEIKNAYKAMAQKIDKEFQERRKAIKGYRIVCENFIQSEDGPCLNTVEEKEDIQEIQEIQESRESQESQESQGEQKMIKREPIENIEKITFISQASSSELGNETFSDIFIPYMVSAASPESTSPSLSDNLTIYDYDSPPMSPISPLIQQDFPHINDPFRIYYYNNDYTESYNNLVYNAEVYPTVDVNAAKSIWNQSSNGSNDAEYYCGSPNNIDTSYLWN